MADRIKIMFIAQAYPGGVPVYIEMLAKHLDSSKYEKILVCSYAYEEARFAPYFDVIEKVGMERSISVSKILKPAWATRKLIKKYKPDVVYCNSSIAGAVGRLAAIGCGVKVLYNAHSWAFNMRISNKKKLFYRWIEKFFAVFTDKIICVSNFEKKSALDNHICSEKKLEVIYNGVDIAEIREKIANTKLTRGALGIPEDAFVVGMVGRIAEQKAPDVFVKAAQIIKDAIPEAFFIIVGNGPDQAEIEKMISDFGLRDSFLITGWVNNPVDYLALFDVACLLSRWEAFGLVLAEYMVARKPVVCTNADAMPELVHNGENGFVVDVDDVDAIEKAVVHMYEDASFVINLSETAANIVRNKFDLAGTTRKFTELINVIVN